MPFPPEVLKTIYDLIMPWSAPHPNDGKLIPLEEKDFKLAGYPGIFLKGDFVFAYTKEPNSDIAQPAIYVVENVKEWEAKKGFQIYWRLVLLGGYGVPVVALYYQHPLGENPHIYTNSYFKDYGHGSLPKLNYYVTRVVANKKTVWDVEDRLRSQ